MFNVNSQKKCHASIRFNKTMDNGQIVELETLYKALVYVTGI